MRKRPRKRPDYRVIKLRRPYTVGEVADKLQVHDNSVRLWMKQGLPFMADQRPFLMLGADIVDFLRSRRRKAKQPCGPGEIFCFGCKAPRSAAEGMADYIPITAKTGNLCGICPICESFMFRCVSLARLDAAKGDLEVKFPQADRHIAEMSEPPLECDIEPGA